MEQDSIALLQTAARGLVEAMKRKGYPHARAEISASTSGRANAYLRTAEHDGPRAFEEGYHRSDTAFAYGATLSAIVAAALDKIAKMRPAADPLLAATLGIVEVEPGLWVEKLPEPPRPVGITQARAMEIAHAFGISEDGHPVAFVLDEETGEDIEVRIIDMAEAA